MRCHGRRGSRIAPFRGSRWPAVRRRRGRRAWRDDARGACSGISPAAARPGFRDIRPGRCRHGRSRARVGGRCGEGCASDASLLPEPAVHRPFLPAARRVAGPLAAFLRPSRRAWRRCGFEQQRANRVKRMRANHTRCMCVESVKRFRIGSVRSFAGSPRCVVRNARCVRVERGAWSGARGAGVLAPRALMRRLRRIGPAAASTKRRPDQRRLSRGARSAPPAAARHRCRARAGGSAGCRPPVRTHAPPSR